MPAPPLRRRRRPFARSAAQTTSRRPARSRIPPATGAARRAVRSGTSTGCSRQTATAAAAEDGAEGRDPPGLARKAGAAPDSAYAGIDSRTQRSSGHTTGQPGPSLANTLERIARHSRMCQEERVRRPGRPTCGDNPRSGNTGSGTIRSGR